MTPEIKQRIEQIKNGIIPKGYKKTFDGFFPNDWETVRLGDIFKERVEKGREDLPLLSITGNEGVIPRSQISRKDSSSKDKSKYLRICKGDIGYNTMRMWQGVSALSNYEGIVSPAYTVLKPTDGVCTKYFAYLFKTEKNIFKFYRYSQGLVDDTRNLKYNSFKIIQVTIPPVKEQQKIVAILSAQDKVIECYEKKIEQLKRMKKYYLQNMFPKRGETVPKIRFKGFTESWEQRKLGDLAIFNPKAELPDIFEYVDLESVVGTEMLTHRTESKRTAPSRAQRLARTGDLFYQTVRPYQKNNYLFEKPDKHYVFSTGYAQMRPIMDGRFLLCLVQNDSFVKVVLDNCTGTSYPAINSNDLAGIEVYSPSNPQEQTQIGDFFKDIDTLITLHQRKLEEEKKKKKALQQLLLTGIVRTN